MLEVEREEAPPPRELRPVAGTSLDDLDLDLVNGYIQHLNWPVRVETLKADLDSARPFLERRGLLREGEVTALGLLVASPHPEAYLNARCRIRLETPSGASEFGGSILSALDESLTALLRAARQVSSREGEGSAGSPLPDEVLRQAVHNAIAHRDYAINKPTVVRLGPTGEVTVTHPGRLSPQLLVESADPAFPLRGILPAVAPPNGWLTEVLHVFRKWDGRRVGMTTLLRHCLEGELDLPLFRLAGGEVRLTLRGGGLWDAAVEAQLQSCDAFLESRNGGQALPREQLLALAYLMKSEWAHAGGQHTLLLTPESPVNAELTALARMGVVVPHPEALPERPQYVVARQLMRAEYTAELEARLGPVVHELSAGNRELLSEVYRQEKYSRAKSAAANRTALCLWCRHRAGKSEGAQMEAFLERSRQAFNRLRRSGFLVKARSGRGYVVNAEYQRGRLF